MKKHIFRMSAAIVSAVLICGNVPFSADADSIREVNVSTTEQLISALADAKIFRKYLTRLRK